MTVPHAILTISSDAADLLWRTRYGRTDAADYTRRYLDVRPSPVSSVRPGTQQGCVGHLRHHPRAFGGQEAILPVADTVVRHASPRSAIGFLIHAAGLSHVQLGDRINLMMPGVCCTVAEQIEALRRVAGDKVAARIHREPDALITRIVAGWPQRFDPKRALALGFKVEHSFEAILRVHIHAEHGRKIAA